MQNLLSNSCRTQAYFDRLCDRYGASHKSLGWYSRASQEKRYDAVLNCIGLDDLLSSRIVDVGCGHGDFLSYLQKIAGDQVHTDRYVGMDLSPKMIDIARKNHPDARFLTGDLIYLSDILAEAQLPGEIDYIVASGVFNLKMDRQLDQLRSVMKRCYGMVKKGVVMTMLSAYAPRETQDNRVFYYYDPQQILALSLSICQQVALKHDYLDNDLLIFLKKQKK